MRILVTGVTGQVGRAVLARLRDEATIVAADRATLDLGKPQAIAAALDRLAPDIIVNPAAYTAVDKAEEEAELAMRVNGEAPGAIARWAAAHAVPFIHFSTDYVFDGSGERAWRETDAAHPLSVYGASKLAGENKIRAVGGCFLIVRSSWVYAAHGANFLRTIVRLARERKELRIVADQIGAPTSAALIADALASTSPPRLGICASAARRPKVLSISRHAARRAGMASPARSWTALDFAECRSPSRGLPRSVRMNIPCVLSDRTTRGSN